MKTEKIKIPTLKQKVKQYEDLLHKINLYCACGDNDSIRKLVSNIDNWSYAHRVSNGELSETEQEQVVAARFWKLLDTEGGVSYEQN